MVSLREGPIPAGLPNAKDKVAEGRLIADVLAKDRKATAEFVSLCTDWLFPFMRRRLVPRDELVEDLMQETLFAAWQALPTFRGDANLRGWVLGIARHKLDDYYRKRMREIEVSEEDEPDLEPAAQVPFEKLLDAAAQQKKIETTLALMPEAYTLVLIWRYRDEKSLGEMAKLSGKTEKAIERLLARARESFRRRWNDVRL